MTRARTGPLALRGPALSLNHAFHLELERAQLLRVVMLTPGEATDCAADGGCLQGKSSSLLVVAPQRLQPSSSGPIFSLRGLNLLEEK